MTNHSTPADVLASPKKLPWYRKLGMQVLVSLLLGILVGFAFPKFASQLKLLGDMFLALIKCGVAPLVFLTIVHGIASAGDVKSAGRVGWRAIVYFEVVSTIALVIGMLAGNLLETGRGMTAVAGAVPPPAAAKAAPQGFLEFMAHIIPDNFVGAFAKGELLQVVVLAVMMGIGILAIPEHKRVKINVGLDYISEVLFSFINLVMKLAPIGTFGAVAYSVGSSGAAVLIALTQLVLSFYGVVFLILLLMLLTSKGAATVSGGSFVVFAATVTSTGILPIEGLAVIFGVYRFLSMAIATCNTIGNSVATVVIAKWSGSFDAAVAERHLYPERFHDAELADGNPPPEDAGVHHPRGIALTKAG